MDEEDVDEVARLVPSGERENLVDRQIDRVEQ